MSVQLSTPHGVMLHHFKDRSHPAVQGALSADTFKDLINGLGSPSILSADVWLDRFLKCELRDGDRCLTFDDGLLCQYDVALPVLEDANLKAFFFPYTSHLDGDIPRLDLYKYFKAVHFQSPKEFYDEFLETLRFSIEERELASRLANVPTERYLAFPDFYSADDRQFQIIRDFVISTEQYQFTLDAMIEKRGISLAELVPKVLLSAEHVREISKLGHVIGLHSHTHPTRLGDLSIEKQRQEYMCNAECLTELTGEPIISMSHPSNHYKTKTLSLLTELGIKLGFRADTRIASGSNLEVPRLDHMDCCIALNIV